MSAGASTAALAVNCDLNALAPTFRFAVERALDTCAARGRDAIVYEANRSLELQQEYYKRGRTEIPPSATVTNAPTNLFSWHGFGLAVDVISRANEWDAPREWFADVAACFREQGCRWGGEWTKPDLPHFQWGMCKPSPSDRARELLATGGMSAVWEAVGAG